MATTKNLCAQIPIDLHERVSEERERLGQTTSEYIANLIQKHSPFYSLKSAKGGEEIHYAVIFVPVLKIIFRENILAGCLYRLALHFSISSRIDFCCSHIDVTEEVPDIN